MSYRPYASLEPAQNGAPRAAIRLAEFLSIMAARNFAPLCAFLALAAAIPALAQQTVDQVLDRYKQAVGGQAAFEKVTARAIKGTVVIPDENSTSPLTIVAKAPASFRMKMDIEGWGVVETVLDGDNGWEKNPDSGVHAMSKADLAAARRDHDFYREMRLKDLYPKMEIAGQDKVEGHAVVVVEATPASGPAEKLYFDADSGLLLKRDYERVTLEDGIVQYEVLLRDYRDVEGMKMPFVIEQRSPDNTMIFKFAEVRNNPTLAADAFAKPEK